MRCDFLTWLVISFFASITFQKSPQASILSENIEGYCGDKSISYLLEYIESTKGGGLGAKNSGGGGVKSKSTGYVSKSGGADKHRGRASTDDDIRNSKKLPVKAKERLKKSTSLEDLRHVKSGGGSAANGGKSGSAKQSSVDDSRLATPSPGSPEPSSPKAAETATSPAADQLSADERVYLDSLMLDDDNYTEESEFHLVTKKQRKKKRRSESRSLRPSGARDNGSYYEASAVGLGAGAAHKRTSRSSENRHRSRRKSVSSVVPSDKISDTDSIHSLPVSSTTPKCKVKKKSTSSGCTPQASYADIAKSPQYQNSTMLGGGVGGGGGDAKWHKGFANSSSHSSPSSSASSSASCAPAIGSYSSACSSNVAETTGHNADTPQLVPKCEGEHVESDGNCDRLALTHNNSNVSNNLVGSSTNSSDQIKNNDRSRPSDKCGDPTNSHNDHNYSSYNSCGGSRSISDTGANDSIAQVHKDAKTNVDDVASVDVTLNRAGKTNRKAESEDNDGAANAASTASRKSKKKRGNVGAECVADAENAGEMFVEYTLKCSTAATSAANSSPRGASSEQNRSSVAGAPKSQKTQTNSAEASASVYKSDVSVARTVVLKNAASKNARSEDANRSRNAGPATIEREAGTKVLVLPSAENSRVSVQFDVDDELATDCGDDTARKNLQSINGDSIGANAVTTSASSSSIAGAASKVDVDSSFVQPSRQSSTNVQRVNSEKSGRYNVAEVIQFVNKSKFFLFA